MIITDVMKITKAGQVTIPKVVRDTLKSDTIIFEISDNNDIRLIPIKSAAGALREFAKTSTDDLSSIQNDAWQKQTQRLGRSNEQ